MAKITHLIYHHFGGLGQDNYASTQHLTYHHVDQAHANRWREYENDWEAYTSELNGSHVGYNIVIEKDGSWKQARYIGEETAGVSGYNYNGVHMALAGNFNRMPGGRIVDTPTQEQINTATMLGKAIVTGRAESVGVKVKAGTVIKIPFANVLPHRALAPTMCYGTSLSDTFFRDKVVADVVSEVKILTTLVNVYVKLVELLRVKQIQFGTDRRFDDPDNLQLD